MNEFPSSQTIPVNLLGLLHFHALAAKDAHRSELQRSRHERQAAHVRARLLTEGQDSGHSKQMRLNATWRDFLNRNRAKHGNSAFLTDWREFCRAARNRLQRQAYY
jgi:hypothetical protein